MSSVEQKIPFAQSINAFTDRKMFDEAFSRGQSWPCHVVEVMGAIVTVAFDIVPNAKFSLPLVTVPVFGPEYIRYPIQIGDLGVCLSATASLRGVSGLGIGQADLNDSGNLSSLVFFPLGNKNWETVDDQALVMYGPNGVVLRDIKSKTTITLTPSEITIVRGDTNISIDDSSVNITADLITLNGDMEFNGRITQTNKYGHGTTANLIGPIIVTNDVVAEGKSLATHEHTVNQVQTGEGSIITTEPN